MCSAFEINIDIENLAGGAVDRHLPATPTVASIGAAVDRNRTRPLQPVKAILLHDREENVGTLGNRATHGIRLIGCRLGEREANTRIHYLLAVGFAICVGHYETEVAARKLAIPCWTH